MRRSLWPLVCGAGAGGVESGRDSEHGPGARGHDVVVLVNEVRARDCTGSGNIKERLFLPLDMLTLPLKRMLRNLF